MFIRTLIILIGIWMLWRIFQGYKASLENEAENQTKQKKQNQAMPEKQHMLPCAFCGMHIPEQEAIHRGDKVYCCQEHRLADENQR
ncbi:PP0621 family protein [Candidatus Venteria ishoeyi]|uniref:Uncharacterized protein n=1 Tax=Candidatus Venteria ishoeyi TaxID=1899563 RepID=A0A1H6FHJ9_9GAMM|nr:PP0621 family protein [Candidatus Venteria ishoeyi]MDM8545477.1 PP0621 family protein [Candidatus Venteria ishoeyi]SEH08474.1 Uncharacterised protein [Candidatus Venteria ishoeyi]